MGIVQVDKKNDPKARKVIFHNATAPPLWLRNPHIQTLWPQFTRKKPHVQLARERVEMADGDFIDLAWSVNDNRYPVLVLHGLEGSLESHYALPTIHALNAAGFKAGFMHMRGCSGEPNRLTRSYHSGATEDLAAILSHLTKSGRHAVAAVGFSLGGNLLLKYLGEFGSGAGLRAAVAISVPFKLKDAAQRLTQGFSRLYQVHILNQLKHSYKKKFETRTSPLNINLKNIRSIYEYDDQITAPLNCFKGVEDYYSRCSCHGYLKNITTSTLILHAQDDPFMYERSIPHAEELGPGIHLELYRHGGHVGFVQNTMCQTDYLTDRIIPDYLLSQLGDPEK
jgi:predicted alpha/beta-fold hydrolase